MRRHARKDANHSEIVSGLRSVGCSVLDLAQLGGGVPDLLVGYRRQTILIEVKAPDAKGRLSGGAARSAVGQSEWADRWRGGPVMVVTSLDEALNAVGCRRNPRTHW